LSPARISGLHQTAPVVGVSLGGQRVDSDLPDVDLIRDRLVLVDRGDAKGVEGRLCQITVTAPRDEIGVIIGLAVAVAPSGVGCFVHVQQEGPLRGRPQRGQRRVEAGRRINALDVRFDGFFEQGTRLRHASDQVGSGLPGGGHGLDAALQGGFFSGPGSNFRGLLAAALRQRRFGNIVLPRIGHAGRQVGGELSQQLGGAVHAFAQVRHAPAIAFVRRIGGARAPMRSGGQQDRADFLIAQVGIAFHQDAQRAGHMGRGHGCAAGQCVFVVAGHVGAEDAEAGRGDAPVLGQPALVETLVARLLKARCRDPVFLDLGTEVGQAGACRGICNPRVAVGPDLQHAILQRDVGGRVQPGFLAGAVHAQIGLGETRQRVVVVGVRWRAPAAVDGAHARGRQVAIGGLEIVVVHVGPVSGRVRAVGVGGVVLAAKRDAHHALAVLGGGDGARYVVAVVVVRTDFFSRIRRVYVRAGPVEGFAGAPGELRTIELLAVVQISAFDPERDEAAAGEFLVRRQIPRIHRAQLHARAAQAARVSILRVHRAQAPVCLEFRVVGPTHDRGLLVVGSGAVVVDVSLRLRRDRDRLA
jgi:hypothetical protein